MAACPRTASTLPRGLPGPPSTPPRGCALTSRAASLTRGLFPLYSFQAPRLRLYLDGRGPAHRPHAAPRLAWSHHLHRPVRFLRYQGLLRSHAPFSRLCQASCTASTLLRGFPGPPSMLPSSFRLVPVATSLTRLFFCFISSLFLYFIIVCFFTSFFLIPFILIFCCSIIHFLTRSFIHSLIHSFTHSLAKHV
jgi:hypothetical protein